jgi:hypothetical protein
LNEVEVRQEADRNPAANPNQVLTKTSITRKIIPPPPYPRGHSFGLPKPHNLFIINNIQNMLIVPNEQENAVF